MIYCNIKGGLGNMLFQIVATKSMAKDLNTDCSIPNLNEYLVFLNEETTHNPILTHSLEYMEYLDLFKNIKTVGPENKNIPVHRFPFNYVNYSLPTNSDFFIDGFFQSEKYFVHNRAAILEWMKIPTKINEIIKEKYSDILTKNATSIHVRRGDYLKFPDYHFVQTLDYFMNGVEFLKSHTDVFVVFSDDIQWCKDNFKMDNVIFVENEKDYVELYLMSLCKHNVTSNSSFSWWGAWLNDNSNKIVVGPRNWFGPRCGEPTFDILPNNWIKF